MIDESRKIMHAPDIRVSATCVRVPVMVSHSAAVHFELTNYMEPHIARGLLMDMPGVRVLDRPTQGDYPMPWDVSGEDSVFVGRIRRDSSDEKGIAIWVVSDNLRKGAALNSIQIAEELVDRECLRPGSTPKPKFRFGEPENPQDANSTEDYAYYRANVDELLPEFEGKYVAIINRTIVDTDDDERSLEQRVYAKYERKSITIARVSPGPRIMSLARQYGVQVAVGNI